MIHSLQRDCVRLNDRQDRILQLFGRLAHSKYEINRGGDHAASNSTRTQHTKGNARRGEGKAEVYYDMKWKPMVEAHQKLMASISGSPSSYTYTPSSSPSIQSINSHQNKEAQSNSSRLTFSLTSPSTTIKNTVLPASLSVLSNVSSSVNVNPVAASSNPLESGTHKQKKEKRIVSSAVAKYLLSAGTKGFGKVKMIQRDSGMFREAESGPSYIAAMEAVARITGEPVSDFKQNSHQLSFLNIANSVPISEWAAGSRVKRQTKPARTRRFISNSPSFFNSGEHGSSPAIASWSGYLRGEIRKTMETSWEALKSNDYEGRVGRKRRQRRDHLVSRNINDGDDSDFDLSDIATHTISQGESQLREVISTLDEKLRDLKKKYAEEMRRSLHIQSELMKAESEKLDLVEHFSRLLEEKDIELGFLQKSARGDEHNESYFGSVSSGHPPALSKDFFKKGILEKEEKQSPSQVTPKANRPISPASNPPDVAAPTSPLQSSRSSASSVADLMRFEAALEQILPDLGPDESLPVGELDKELFERFVMQEDQPVTSYSGPNSPVRTPRSPTSTQPESVTRTPRSASQTPRSASQTPRSASQTPRSASQTPRSATQTPRSATQTPRSSKQSPRSTTQTPKSNAHTPRSSHKTNKISTPHKFEEDGADYHVNTDSDFDEFAEFAEYQDYEVEDANEPSESEGYYSNRSRPNTQRTQSGHLSSQRTNPNTTNPHSSRDTSHKKPIYSPPTNHSHKSPNDSLNSFSDEELLYENRSPPTNNVKKEQQPVRSSSNKKSDREDVDTRFTKDLDRYMDMDLQDLMTLVNEKYRADDSDQEDIDPVDIEALKKQYGFDD